jgi:hypothetical protein
MKLALKEKRDDVVIVLVYYSYYSRLEYFFQKGKIIVKKNRREKNVVYVGAVGYFETIRLPSSILKTKATAWLVGTSIDLTGEWVCSTTPIVVEA